MGLVARSSPAENLSVHALERETRVLVAPARKRDCVNVIAQKAKRPRIVFASRRNATTSSLSPGVGGIRGFHGTRCSMGPTR